MSLSDRAASDASPSASPRASSPGPATSSDVLAVQQRLKDRGYYSGPVDGVMGPGTQGAILAYQRDRGLTATGTLDAQTAGALNGETSAVTLSPPAVDVRAAQRELRSRGCYSGPVDGVIGAATEVALRAYQRDRGLKVTGRLDAPTVRSLTS